MHGCVLVVEVEEVVGGNLEMSDSLFNLARAEVISTDIVPLPDYHPAIQHNRPN